MNNTQEAPPVSERAGEPPAGSVEIPTTHWLELRAWRQPNGSKLVELIDDTEETWQSYCRMMTRRSRALLVGREGVA